MSVESSNNSLGPTLLTIAFVVLKLTHAINWSWWWVLSPIWIQFVLGVILFIIVWFQFKSGK